MRGGEGRGGGEGGGREGGREGGGEGGEGGREVMFACLHQNGCTRMHSYGFGTRIKVL